VQKATGFLFSSPAPLFEKKPDALLPTLSEDFLHPVWFHAPSSWTGLATNYDPRNTSQVNVPKILEQGLDREKSDRGPRLTQMF